MTSDLQASIETVIWIQRALPGLHRRARAMVRSPADLDDHVQATVLEVLRRPARAPRSDERAFQRWLAAVLRNNVRDGARRRRTPTLPFDLLDAAASDRDDGPVGLAAAAEERQLVERAVAGLPPAQRQAVRLCLLAGGRQRDVATVLGRSEDAVQALLARARRRLAAALGVAGARRRAGCGAGSAVA